MLLTIASSAAKFGAAFVLIGASTFGVGLLGLGIFGVPLENACAIPVPTALPTAPSPTSIANCLSQSSFAPCCAAPRIKSAVAPF